MKKRFCIICDAGDFFHLQSDGSAFYFSLYFEELSVGSDGVLLVSAICPETNV